MKADQYRFDGSNPCILDKLPCDSKADKADKAQIQARTEANLETMASLQDALYADGREGVIFVLQALDAAGKDSTIKHVMGGMNPQGVLVHSFKQPTSEELQHDFLWRVNKALPPRGSVAIFNRSYYEDVLVVQLHDMQKGYQMAQRVLNEDKKKFFRKRYRQIRDYEEYLYDNSYRVVKIFLHLSKEEQKKRFLERLEKPAKNWKFSAADLRERALFDDYQKLYEEVINETASEYSPWYVLPADQKWYTRYLVSEIVVDTLKKCHPSYPRLSEDARSALAEYKAKLKAD